MSSAESTCEVFNKSPTMFVTGPPDAFCDEGSASVVPIWSRHDKRVDFAGSNGVQELFSLPRVVPLASQ
jgi:hypothetical protein